MPDVDSSEVRKLLVELDRAVKDTWQDTGTFFKNSTPVRSGNARSRTRTVGERITADYGYAGRLDEGWSKQAPTGMTEPSVEYFVNQLTARIGRL